MAATIVQSVVGNNNAANFVTPSTAGNTLICTIINNDVCSAMTADGGPSGPLAMQKVHLQKYNSGDSSEVSIWALFNCPAGLTSFTPTISSGYLMTAAEFAGVPVNASVLTTAGAKGLGTAAVATITMKEAGSLGIGASGTTTQGSGFGLVLPWLQYRGTGAQGKTQVAGHYLDTVAGDTTYTNALASSIPQWGVALIEIGAPLLPPPGIISLIPSQSDELGVAIAPLNSAGYFSGTVDSYSATGLPAGLTINTSSGVIEGTPNTVNSYSTTVIATNAGGSTNNGPFTWDIVGVAPVWAVIPDQENIEGSSVRVNMAPYVIDGSPPFTYAEDPGNPLPDGLVIQASGGTAGLVTGTPTQQGNYTVVLVATNPYGAVSSASFGWRIDPPNVNEPLLDLPNTHTAPESAGPETWDLAPYNIGAPATSWSTSGGPPGTTIDNAGVMTTDLTTAEGFWTISVTATNASGASTDFIGLTVTSSNPVLVSQPPLRFNTINDTVDVNMGVYISGATSWSATGLPAGLSINPTSGHITGTIGGTAQVYNPIITGTNIHGFVQTTFQWTVQPLPVVGNKRYGRK